MSFERDLERWEVGAMSDDELVRSHPGEDVDGLLALHERMIAAAAAPVSLDEGALQGFLARLPDRARPRRRYRSVLLAVAAVLLTASMAVAVPGVHHGVTAITHGVGRLFGIGSSPATGPAPSEAPPTLPGDDTTADQPGGSGDAHDADDHHAGGRDGGSGSEGDQGQDQQSDEGSGTEGDQGQDQQSDGNSGGSSDEGSGSSGSSSGSGSDSSGDHGGDGSGGDTQSSGGGGEQ